jgi:hypothetical protein
MLRRIVVTRSQEPLRTAWATRSFAAAGAALDNTIKVSGMLFDEQYHPVRVPGETVLSLTRPATVGFNYAAMVDATRPAAYGMRAVFDNEEAIERLKAEKSTEVVGVFV